MTCPKREMTATECLEVLARLFAGLPQTLQIDTRPQAVSGLIASILEMARVRGFAIGSMNLETVERIMDPVPLAAGLEEELHVQIRRGARNSSLVDRLARHLPKGVACSRTNTLLIIDASDYDGDHQLIDVERRARAFGDQMDTIRLWIVFIHDEQNQNLGPVVADDLKVGWIKVA